MRRIAASVALFFTLAGAACEPAYIDAIAPKDAKFQLVCKRRCGLAGREPGLAIEVGFLKHRRQLSMCCKHRNEVLARLQTVRDFWCDGLDAAPKTIGPLTIGTTVSEATGKRGATIDQGDGYVAFNCDDWLPKLIEQLKTTTCCATPG